MFSHYHTDLKKKSDQLQISKLHINLDKPIYALYGKKKLKKEEKSMKKNNWNKTTAVQNA